MAEGVFNLSGIGPLFGNPISIRINYLNIKANDTRRLFKALLTL